MGEDNKSLTGSATSESKGNKSLTGSAMSESKENKSLTGSGFERKGGYASGPPTAKLPTAPKGSAPGVSAKPKDES